MVAAQHHHILDHIGAALTGLLEVRHFEWAFMPARPFTLVAGSFQGGGAEVRLDAHRIPQWRAGRYAR